MKSTKSFLTPRRPLSGRDPPDGQASRATLEARAKLARAGNQISRSRSPAAAKRLAMRVRDARTLLTEHPKSAQAGQIPGTRRFVIPPYILTVRRKDGITEIVAIRHAQQGDAYAPEELLDDGVVFSALRQISMKMRARENSNYGELPRRPSLWRFGQT